MDWKILLFVFCLVKNVIGEYIPPGPKYRCPKQRLLLHPCECVTESDVGITVHCENSNLASMSIGLNNLGTFQLPIERLIIRKCHFKRLFGSLLYKLQLRTLLIEDVPLLKIEEHTFLGVNNTLNELEIINTSLVEYPSKAFQILGNLTLLKLDTHQIAELPADAFATELAGRLTKFHLTNGNLSSINAESLQSLRRLRVLDLHGNKLTDLKRNQFKGLREAEVLDLSHNSIAKLDASHLGDLTKLGWCNVSYNQLTELTRGAFARNSVLKWLHMGNNKIRKLDSNSFRGMRFLRRLYLNDNLISDVGRGTFATISRIGTIDLARNLLKTIDYQMFHELNFVEVIDVSQNNVTEIQKSAFKDLFLTQIKLDNNAISKIEPGSFINCANITLLDLSHNRIANIPKKAFDETTYATDFRITHNIFTDLSQIPLANMSGLRILNASYNAIAKIPRHTFPKLYELHTIDLSHNNLSDIFNAVFQTLFSLRTLNLSHNSLTQLKPSTFGPIPTLLELDLCCNGLEDLAKSALTRMASMRQLNLSFNKLSAMFSLPISVSHLDISHNRFSELPRTSWPSMNALLTLNMSYNNLSDNLVQGSFENLLTLQRLDLSFNDVSLPPWPALGDLSSIQYLNMRGNKLRELNKAAFGRLPVLFDLNLSDNYIAEVRPQAFDGLLQLISLNLERNNITFMAMEAFKGLVAMQQLDLSHNRIEKLDNGTHGLLEDCLSLEKLDLSHNKISFITRKTFPSNPYFPYKLREIDLSYNTMPVLTYDLVFGTKQVEKLNLSHNAIAGIRNYVIGNLSKLEDIDLSYNNLEDISSEREAFRLPANVSHVGLGCNQLTRLPWAHIKRLQSLRVLDLNGNQLSAFDRNLSTLMVANVTRVDFRGNPLRCDCLLRPLKRFLNQKLPAMIMPEYRGLQCTDPPYLKAQYLVDVAEERLICPMNVRTDELLSIHTAEYALTPDLKVRELSLNKDVIKVKWLVVKNDDVADTFIIVRPNDRPEELAFETTLPYFQRSLEIPIEKISFNTKPALQSKGGKKERLLIKDYEICILAKDSLTMVKGFNPSQCRSLSELASRAGSLLCSKLHIYSISLFIILLLIRVNN